jgi:hypothetical protein
VVWKTILKRSSRKMILDAEFKSAVAEEIRDGYLAQKPYYVCLHVCGSGKLNRYSDSLRDGRYGN